MTLASFTRKLNAKRAENGQKPLTAWGVQYRIIQLIERGTLVEADIRTQRETGTYEWHLSDALLITVADFQPKLYRNRRGIGRPGKRGSKMIVKFIGGFMDGDSREYSLPLPHRIQLWPETEEQRRRRLLNECDCVKCDSQIYDLDGLTYRLSESETGCQRRGIGRPGKGKKQ